MAVGAYDYVCTCHYVRTCHYVCMNVLVLCLSHGHRQRASVAQNSGLLLLNYINISIIVNCPTFMNLE